MSTFEKMQLSVELEKISGLNEIVAVAVQPDFGVRDANLFPIQQKISLPNHMAA